MTFSEILWWILAGVLALVALFWLVASLFNLLHPRITVTIVRVILDAVVVAACAGFAYGIWVNFLH